MKISVYAKAIFCIGLLTLHPSLITTSTAQTYNFYGTTKDGGTNSTGTILKFDPSSLKDTVLWNFGGSGIDGIYPNGGLVFDSINGLFYGLTFLGGVNDEGIIFSFNMQTDSEKVVWNFGNDADGSKPEGTLVYDSATGLFYGTLSMLGTNNSGAIFSFNPVTDSEKVVWTFGNGTDGSFPTGNLVYYPSGGLFYGTTEQGGINHVGTIFSFDPVKDLETLVVNFTGGNDGSTPFQDMVYDGNNGLFYLMTSQGGEYSGEGAIVSFDPTTNRDSLVWSFGNGTDAAQPYGNLTFDSARGLFYGMTYGGGSNGKGAVISFDPSDNSETLLWSFGNGHDGTDPEGSFTYDPYNGLLYGMAYAGGDSGYGGIITFDPATDSETVIWNFDGTNGAHPGWEAPLIYPLQVSSGISATGSNSLPAINIYPNPSNGRFTITGLTKGQMLELFNDLGQRISLLTVDDAMQQLDISTQANGIYVVRIVNYDGTPVARKKVEKVN